MAGDRAVPTGATLVWDVDDVLNSLTRDWFAQEWLPAHPAGPVTEYGRLTENPPHRLLGVTREEYLASLDAFRRRRYGGLEPDPAIRAWMEREGHRFRHVALTAVPLAAASFSGEWLFRVWGRWIRGVHVVPSPRPGCEAPAWDASKVGFLRWLGHGDAVLIEDNPAVCAAAVAAGFRALLVPQPWNAGGVPGAGAIGDLTGVPAAGTG